MNPIDKFKKITEEDSLYRHIEKMPLEEVLQSINAEDHKIAPAIKACIPTIEALVLSIVPKMKEGGRLIYIGAGTSGRLGILDASECPPTFGVPFDWVIGLIAGGDQAIRRAVEHAEDDVNQAWKDLEGIDVSILDTIVGLATSGTTPYVVNGLKKCREEGIATGCITCNPGAPIIHHSDFPIVPVVGPEFITGSTRMKSGTAQKMILNMISTSVMIGLGRVQDNKMVDMQLSNNKLIERGTLMIVKQSDLSYAEAQSLLIKHGSVRDALRAISKS